MDGRRKPGGGGGEGRLGRASEHGGGNLKALVRLTILQPKP
jgi:hypothetical protein